MPTEPRPWVRAAQRCPDGLLVVDKPAGMTSHDVVSRIRALAATGKVGHGGTLDPDATGVLIIAIGKATRLLNYILGSNKTYTARIRVGIGTLTDDAAGEITATPGYPGPGQSDLSAAAASLHAALPALTGEIMQIPAAVSAIKINGKRAYARVRAGEEVALSARPVTIRRFTIGPINFAAAHGVPVADFEAEVDCSTGTYIRSLARDLGKAVGSAGHLLDLRRTAVGNFSLTQALPLEALEAQVASQDPHSSRLELVTELPAALAELFGNITVDAAQASALRYGRSLDIPAQMLPKPANESKRLYGAIGTDGQAVALVESKADKLVPIIVFPLGQPEKEATNVRNKRN